MNRQIDLLGVYLALQSGMVKALIRVDRLVLHSELISNLAARFR